MKIPNDVLGLFDNLCKPDRPIVWIATSVDNRPHVVPVCFIKPLDGERILVGNVFISQTEQNILKNPSVAIGVAQKEDGWDGYMLKGRAEVLKRGPIFERFKEEVFEASKGRRAPNSAISVEITEVYSLKPRSGVKRLY